ncbi:MAG: HlyD family efflux transporter periplasmic adaptor subunit [Nocardioidaceae bacterium]|nr:HlyD family efflux transporter periplasmic adaptor subunit [Nocardioidaceae bacterium]
MGLPQRLLRWPVVAAAAVVLAGGGTAYAVGRDDGGPDYRTVTATTGDVEQVLASSGVVDAARRADLSFGTNGTVAKVDVDQGDTVRAGQVVATLDPTDLEAAVTDAKASLAQAVARLEADQDAQASAVQNASNDQPKQPSAPQQPSKPSPALQALAAQQKAVREAQSAASAALAAAKSALAAQTAACADAYGAAATPTATPTDAGADPDPQDPQDAKDAACDTALADVQAEQAAVKDAQDTLAQALDVLAGTLTKALGSVTSPETGNARTAAETPTSPSSQGDTSGGGGTVTAAQLASDQAQIDQAKADLAEARAQRAQATLRATRSGTVAALDLAVGDQVSTGSTVATIVGGRAVTLTLSIAETSIDEVRVGQAARVGVPGTSTTTEGRVTAIGMVADTSTGTTSYPVTVTVEDPSIALPTGSRASVSIVTATAKDVVTVPISAVSGTGSTGTVRVWNGSTATRTRVTLGVRGARTVQVTGGVKAGTRLVVADADQAITGAASELNNRGGFGPNGPAIEFRGAGPGKGPVTFVNPGGK